MDTPPPPPSASQISSEVSSQAQGFMGSILDFSFENFVTPKLIKLFYLIMLAGVVLSAFGFLVGNILRGGLGAIIGLIGAPIILVLGAIAARVYVEIVMLAFKILETLQKIEAKQK